MQSTLLTQSEYAVQEPPFKRKQDFVWAPHFDKSHPNNDMHWSSARHEAPNKPLVTQL